MANSNFQRPLAQPYYDERNADQRRSEQESDPLAELARLIGQTDPLSSFSRDDQRERQEPEYEQSEYEPQNEPHQEPHFARDPFARDPYDARHRMTAPAREEEIAETENDAPPPPSWLRGAAWQNERAPQAPAASAADDRFYPDEPQTYAARSQEARHAYDDSADPRYDDALYGRAPTQAYDQDEGRDYDAGPPYSYPGHEQGYDDSYASAEEPPSRRRGGLLTVAIVAALAVVGTAGAFAYRSFSSGTKGGEPAVIRADANPTKVVPPTSSKDPSGKVITDRIGAQGERIVPREEAPLDVKTAATNGPRVVFPPLTQQNAPNPSATNPSQSNAMAGGVSDEPKRIKTVSIRPDQAEQPKGASAGAPAAAAPRQAAPAPAPAAANNGPISLAPPRASAPDTRPVAALPPAAAPTPRATEGGYVVQVSSQRSEADAQASYRALQSRYPNVLASRSPLIKRADLGDKGVYYRAMVGPFASSEQATQVCGDLKNAGGQCLVQRN
jgi:hypothetical protein